MELDAKDLQKRITFIRSVVRKNPVTADGLLKDLHSDIGKAIKATPPPELKQLEIPENQYTRIKGSITGTGGEA